MNLPFFVKKCQNQGFLAFFSCFSGVFDQKHSIIDPKTFNFWPHFYPILGRKTSEIDSKHSIITPQNIQLWPQNIQLLTPNIQLWTPIIQLWSFWPPHHDLQGKHSILTPKHSIMAIFDPLTKGYKANIQFLTIFDLFSLVITL